MKKKWIDISIINYPVPRDWKDVKLDTELLILFRDIFTSIIVAKPINKIGSMHFLLSKRNYSDILIFDIVSNQKEIFGHFSKSVNHRLQNYAEWLKTRQSDDFYANKNVNQILSDWNVKMNKPIAEYKIDLERKSLFRVNWDFYSRKIFLSFIDNYNDRAENSKISPENYPEKLSTFSELVRLVNYFDNNETVEFEKIEWFFTNNELVRLLFTWTEKKTIDFRKVKINLEDFEEWSFKSFPDDKELFMFIEQFTKPKEKLITIKVDSLMKFENSTFYGGTFADIIINNSSVLDETDKKFIELIHNNTSSPQVRAELIKSLSSIKDPNKEEEEKKKSSNLLKKFIESSVSETGKQVVKELIEGGTSYLEGLI